MSEWELKSRIMGLDLTRPIRVRRHHLNSQGYDSDGYYFGTGTCLFHIRDEDGNGFYWRAYDRKAMIRILIETNPRVKAW